MGDKIATGVVLTNVKTKEQKEIKVDGVFISIGSVPTSELAKGIGVKTNENGYIITGPDQETNVPGIFAAGDCTNRAAKKILTAAGYGAAAATSAYNFIKSH